MTVASLLIVRRGRDVIGQCDELCYDAKHPKCVCRACAGSNHGLGYEAAVENTRRMVADWDGPGEVELADALALSACATYDRLKAERNLIDMARRRGVSWPRIACALALPDGRAAQRHHQMLVKLVGSDNWYSDAPGQPRGESS